MTLCPRKQRIICFICTIVLLVIAITAIVLVSKKHSRHTREHMANPNIANYKAELALFKSMHPDEQARYINMTKDEKMSTYGAHLFGNK